jgi:ABC-2 type transport system permease protein
MRALVAAAVMFPVGILILGSVPFHASNLPLLIVVLILGALVGSSIGLTLGTLVAPHRVNLMFSLILLPITFTGCCQYPWPSLHRLEWFQWLTTLNPLTYASEGMRGALVPSLPHMRSWICVLMLLVALGIFGTIGVRGFMRRAID